jgi:spermidine synthase
MIFCVTAAVECADSNSAPGMIVFCILGVGPLALGFAASEQRLRWWPRLQRRLEEHTARIDALPVRQLPFWITVAAGLGLYLELVLIRFHATCFAVFGFYKNLSLLSCFLGLGIGYAVGRRRLLLTPLLLPLLAVQLVVIHLLRFTEIAFRLHNPIPELDTMGLIHARGIGHVIMVYAFLLWVFTFNAVCLIPVGQLASHVMDRMPKKLAPHGWNLLGSLAAVLAFFLLSFLWTPPVTWFAVAIIALTPFLRGMMAGSAITAAIILGVVGTNPLITDYDIYSPYQILTVSPHGERPPSIAVNHAFFQQIFNLGPGARQDEATSATAKYYNMPYLLRSHPKDVLVVGSGTGNDVAAALRNGAEHVDAVEIDPAILQLGRDLHPEFPYQSDRVTSHVQDARAFIRYSQKKYDLIVFGLLDSHTLLSGMSGVRLDSYVYTEECFREARARLSENGIICLSFALFREALGNKLYLMLKDAFDGRDPTVFGITSIGMTDFVIGANPAPPVAPPGVADITPQYSYHRADVYPATDDWPFFYMVTRGYPATYLVLIVILLTGAAIFIRPVVQMGGGRAAVSVPCFLLGAGFMLLETKAITELALYYGTTWVVIGVVIIAILIMAFLANLLVMRWPKIPLPISYGLLLASVALSLWFSGVVGSLHNEWLSRFLATAIITLPLFFSGLVFSSEMDSSRSVAAALGSNLIGAMLGGCLEYNSMYFGYRSLYVLILGIYALSMVVSLTMRLGKRISPPQAVAVK